MKYKIGIFTIVLLGMLFYLTPYANLEGTDEHTGILDSDVYVEDFTSYTQKHYVDDMIWDPWLSELRIRKVDAVNQSSPDVAIDSNGYAFVVWEDSRNGPSGDIYLQRLDPEGNRFWAEDLQVNDDNDMTERYSPALAVDGLGNVLVVWLSRHEDPDEYYVYAQKFDGIGIPQWSQPIQVNSDIVSAVWYPPDLSADSGGNVVVIWTTSAHVGDDNVYAQRLSKNGDRLWVEDVRVGYGNHHSAVAMDNSGDAVIVWSKLVDSFHSDIQLQRVDASGNLAWAEAAKVNENLVPKYENVALGIDSSGNAVVTWSGGSYIGPKDILAQCIDTNGTRLWDNDVRVNINGGSEDQRNPTIAVDDDGYSYIVWDDDRNDDRGVYAQRLDIEGHRIWQKDLYLSGKNNPSIDIYANGDAIVVSSDLDAQRMGENGEFVWTEEQINRAGGTAGQSEPDVGITTDGESVLVWEDTRNGNADIYLQRLDIGGNRLWITDVRVNDVSVAKQYKPSIAVDSNGQAAVAWFDESSGECNIYIQRVDEKGNRQWTVDQRINGVTGTVVTLYYDIVDIAVAVDNLGNTIAAWTDTRNGNDDVYMQKMDGNGNRIWKEDLRVNTDTGTGRQSGPSIEIDSNGDVVVTWLDTYGSTRGIYMQRVDNDGNHVWAEDVYITNSGGGWEHDLDLDSSGNAVLVWGPGQTLAQRVDASGNPLWPEAVNLGAGGDPSVAVDSEGNALIVWENNYNGVFAQRLDINGDYLWSEDVQVIEAIGVNYGYMFPSMALTEDGNAIVTCVDSLNGNADVYAQKINVLGDRQWDPDVQVVDPDFFYLPTGIAQSRQVDTTDDTITEATLTAQYILRGGSVDFYLTNDGGDHWAAVQPGVTHVFTTTGSDLRWRVEMASDPIWRNRSPIVDSLRIEYATTSADGDDYEPDDACNQAQPIQVSGVAQTHNFHQYQDSDWVWFEAQAGTTYLIQTANTGARADTVLELYNQCGQPPDATDDNAFGPGATLSFEAPTSGTYYVRVLQHDGTVYGADTEYDLTVRAQQITQGAAIIVAGRMRENDGVQPIINATANLAYQTFRSAGFADADIYYLNSDLGQPGVDATSTEAHVRDAIQDWARTRVGLGTPLWLYLADHGQVDRFHNEVDEVVTAGELNLWLSNLEATSGVDQINVIIDACHSGSFIDAQEQGDYGLEEISGHGRVVVASTTYSSQAYAPGGSNARMYFSAGFWRALGEGQTLWHAFLAGRSEVESGGVGRCGDYAFDFFCQRPWLDDTGDAWFDGADGQLAQTRGLAASFGGGVAPYIDWVQVGEVTEGQASVEAQVRDDGSVARVWLRVFAPSFEPPTGEDGSISVIDVPEADLGAASGDVFALDYTGFTEEGVYQIVVYAMDDEGNVSVPRSVLVGGQKVYLPLVMRRQ